MDDNNNNNTYVFYTTALGVLPQVFLSLGPGSKELQQSSIDRTMDADKGLSLVASVQRNKSTEEGQCLNNILPKTQKENDALAIIYRYIPYESELGPAVYNLMV